MAKKISLEELAQEHGVEIKVKEEKADYSTYNPSRRDKISKQNNSIDKVNNVFTYPYNFVSLGDSKNINRKSIKENKGNLSGKIKCTLKNITPLFIGGIENSSKGHKEESPLEINENYIIPSSSLKGEIRNIIEVITNSCIRNVEPKRLEKREIASKERIKNTFYGIIHRLPTKDTTGEIVEAIKVKIKRDVLKEIRNIDKNINDLIPGFYKVKVNHKIIFNKDTGERYDFKKDDPKAINTLENYKRIVEDADIEATLWISSEINNKKYEKILIRKSLLEKGNINKFTFTLGEYEDLEYLIDQRNERDVKGKVRREKRIGLNKIEENEPIIFEGNPNKSATHLAFSEIPRLRYKRSPYQLIPKGFQPCTSLEELCFACRLFGTTGNSQETKNSNELVAHIGRVFITDAKIVKNKTKIIKDFIPLKPLGEPRSSLSRFYLTDGTYDEDGAKIRGRKFYWHHSDKIEAGEKYENYIESLKFKKEGSNSNEYIKADYNSSFKFLKPNNTFEFEVEFKNLTDEELGVLIYSLELEEGLLHKFGKAKAFGFGSSKIEIQELLLKSKNRYVSFETSYEKEDTKKYKEIAQKEYVIESKKEIRELKTILSQENKLDFSKSPFPEAIKNGKKNTLNWFTENKNLRLPNILDYKK